MAARRLRPEARDPEALRHDRRLARRTLVLGAALVAVTGALVAADVVPLATTWPGTGRAGAEIAAYVVLFDGYFYALHRLLHTRTLYRMIHRSHHRSRTPTIATALAFHPLEALAIAAFMPLAMWFLPIHLSSLAVVSVFLSGSIVLAHSGYAVFPEWLERTPLLAWYVTPRVHDAHHRRHTCNFGATLSLFDRAFGTLAPRDAHRASTLATAPAMRPTASSVGSPPARANET